MSELYIITGPAGVGKSTVSQELAKTLPKSALIEGDDIYHLVSGGYVSPWKDGNHLDVFWKNCYDLINNFLSDGYDVVFNYIINKEKISRIKKMFPDIKMKFIVLLANEKKLIERDFQRPEDSQMKERVLILLENMKQQNFDERNILDTSNLSIKEIVQIILKEERFIIE